MHDRTHYDVVICGAGLAGLTLARQLKMELPSLTVAVIDRLARPLPEAAHKVGEATSELAAFYLGDVLRLEPYLRQRHLRKLALRFFFGDARGPFEKRPELGARLFPPVSTYQLDRGRLENDLRATVVDMGTDLFEGMVVDDVLLADGADYHAVLFRRYASQQQEILFARWVIDALGRRRMLQSKLDLAVPNGHCASSAWWRVQPRLDISEMVTSGNRRWRRRVVEDRNLSTIHLMGHGYWVWLIPLSSGATSIGIVTDDTIHPIGTYGKSHTQALQWLERYEPALWQLLRDRDALDFHRLKHFSYHARQIFSHRRWSCVGEAGVFLDPLYSTGSDLIAIENTITVEMIRRDLRSELTESAVQDFNRLVLDFVAPLGLAYYKDTYRTFGHAQVYTAKFVWDTLLNSALLVQLFTQNVVRRPTCELLHLLGRYKELHERMQRLFCDWADSAPARATFEFFDPRKVKLLGLLNLDMFAKRSPEQFMAVATLSLGRLEEIAQLLFWQAVEECLPEHLPSDGADPPWVNTWAISLAPERWHADRLYDPTTPPRSLKAARDMFAGVFAPLTWGEYFRIELPYRLSVVARGKPEQALLRLVIRQFIHNKPAMWLHRPLVTNQASKSSPANFALDSSAIGHR